MNSVHGKHDVGHASSSSTEGGSLLILVPRYEGNRSERTKLLMVLVQQALLPPDMLDCSFNLITTSLASFNDNIGSKKRKISARNRHWSLISWRKIGFS
ncbi:hypothetical protein AYI69_g5646 [Smittium culicis]|uniref:Uncharacterized protein n=1 Tax=Smittium culicis TaxID=133412 RepID=A0A1R1Y4W9_9FUNG|nr:hypothetical protein AYI69_g5646 [Smittium culicis]